MDYPNKDQRWVFHENRGTGDSTGSCAPGISLL